MSPARQAPAHMAKDVFTNHKGEKEMPMTNTTITESEVRQFIRQWFDKLEKHPSIEEINPFVARELKISTPAGKDEPFHNFYNDAAKYRDQVHTIKALETIASPDTATVKVILCWERSDSESPSPGMRWTSYTAQTWTLARSTQPPWLCIVEYNVDYLLENVDTLADAIRRCDHQTALTLLSQGYDVNKRDAIGLTPLMIASGLGDVEMVKLLLSLGADVFCTDSSMGITALHKAAQCGSVEVAKLLLDNGAFIDVQAPTLGNTPLMDAVWHKHAGMVEFLLKRKARTELTMRSGTKPIDIADNDTNQVVIEALQKDKQAKDEEARSQKLMTAVKDNNVEIVKALLIDKNVDVNAKAPLVGDRFDGYTPLLAASFLGHQEIVRILLDAGADPSMVDDQIKATAAHKAGYHGRTEAAKVLIDKAVSEGLDLNAQGPYNGYTALHDAIWHCHKDAVEVLLNAQVRLDLKTHSGHTALGLAELYCNCDPDLEIVNLIKAKGGQ